MAAPSSRGLDRHLIQRPPRRMRTCGTGRLVHVEVHLPVSKVEAVLRNAERARTDRQRNRLLARAAAILDEPREFYRIEVL